MRIVYPKTQLQVFVSPRLLCFSKACPPGWELVASSLWFHSSNTSLSLLLQGYLKQARKRTDMFTDEKIAKIFSNIEQIYEFHQEILSQLEECFVEDDPCASEIGSVFLNNVSFFCCFIFH